VPTSLSPQRTSPQTDRGRELFFYCQTVEHPGTFVGSDFQAGVHRPTEFETRGLLKMADKPGPFSACFFLNNVTDKASRGVAPSRVVGPCAWVSSTTLVSTNDRTEENSDRFHPRYASSRDSLCPVALHQSQTTHFARNQTRAVYNWSFIDHQFVLIKVTFPEFSQFGGEGRSVVRFVCTTSGLP
jgi:hypothetical protein